MIVLGFFFCLKIMSSVIKYLKEILFLGKCLETCKDHCVGSVVYSNAMTVAVF